MTDLHPPGRVVFVTDHETLASLTGTDPLPGTCTHCGQPRHDCTAWTAQLEHIPTRLATGARLPWNQDRAPAPTSQHLGPHR